MHPKLIKLSSLQKQGHAKRRQIFQNRQERKQTIENKQISTEKVVDIFYFFG